MIMSTSHLAIERTRRRETRLRQLTQERDWRETAVHARIPRLAEIKANQSDIGLDLARLMLRVPTRFEKTFTELQAWSQELTAERKRLLATNKISESELEIHYDCLDCKNTGWLEAVPAGPDSVHPPRKCHCLIQEEINDLYSASGLAGLLREQVFDKFDLTLYPASDRDYMGKVLAYCRTYAQRIVMGDFSDHLLLLGNVGLGKTFLASAIANHVVAAKRTVVYFTFSEFLDLLRLHKYEDQPDFREGMQRLLDADLIILDDLGAEKVTEFVGQELFNIINHRLNRQLPMVISTNLNPPQIEELYGPRIASRLLNGFSTMPLRGDDVRHVLRRRRSAP